MPHVAPPEGAVSNSPTSPDDELDALTAAAKTRRNTRWLAAAAFLAVVLWIVVFESGLSRTLPNSYERAHHYGYVGGGFVFSLLVATIILAFPGRNLRRFLLGFALTSAFLLTLQFNRLSQGGTAQGSGRSVRVTHADQ